jgi:hypothetical protein
MQNTAPHLEFSLHPLRKKVALISPEFQILENVRVIRVHPPLSKWKIRKIRKILNVPYKGKGRLGEVYYGRIYLPPKQARTIKNVKVTPELLEEHIKIGFAYKGFTSLQEWFEAYQEFMRKDPIVKMHKTLKKSSIETYYTLLEFYILRKLKQFIERNNYHEEGDNLMRIIWNLLEPSINEIFDRNEIEILLERQFKNHGLDFNDSLLEEMRELISKYLKFKKINRSLDNLLNLWERGEIILLSPLKKYLTFPLPAINLDPFKLRN